MEGSYSQLISRLKKKDEVVEVVNGSGYREWGSRFENADISICIVHKVDSKTESCTV